MKSLSFALAILGLFAGTTSFAQERVVAVDVAQSDADPIEAELLPDSVPPGLPAANPPPIGIPGIPGARPPRRPGRSRTGRTSPRTPVPRPPIRVKPGETRFALTLKDGSRLVGRPLGLAKVPVVTSFGEARIPLDQIRSVHGIPNATWVKIRFLNGDLISGTLKSKSIRFKTQYGEIDVPVTAIVSMQLGTSFASASGGSNPRPPRRGGRPSTVRGGPGYAPPTTTDTVRPAAPLRARLRAVRAILREAGAAGGAADVPTPAETVPRR